MSSDIARAELAPTYVLGIPLAREQVVEQPSPVEGVIMTAEEKRLEAERLIDEQNRDMMLQTAAAVEMVTMGFAGELSDLAVTASEAANKNQEKARLVRERAEELDREFALTQSALDTARQQAESSTLEKQLATNVYLDAIETSTAPIKSVINELEEIIALRPTSEHEALALPYRVRGIIEEFGRLADPNNKAETSLVSLLITEVIKHDELIDVTDTNDIDLMELSQRVANHDAVKTDIELLTQSLDQEIVRSQINDRQLQSASNMLRGRHSKAEDRSSLMRAYDSLRFKLARRGIGTYALYGNDIFAPKPVPGTTPLEIEA